MCRSNRSPSTSEPSGYAERALRAELRFRTDSPLSGTRSGCVEEPYGAHGKASSIVSDCRAVFRSNRKPKQPSRASVELLQVFAGASGA